jgi:hypothetical protein
MDEVIIIDDVVWPEKQDEIENVFFTKNLAWKFFTDVAIPENEIKALGITKLTPGIGASILQDQPHYINQPLLDLTETIVHNACSKLGLVCDKIIQGRSFITFPLREELRKEYDNIHIDLNYDHMVCLYYVNDVDGDTVLFEETAGSFKNKTVLKEKLQKNEFKIAYRVTPKKGRCIVFNGKRYHSSSGPTKGVRCIINFNFSLMP